MPEDFDVAVIEGAVTTEESENLVRALRARAAKLIAIGACATTAGIPGMASVGFLSRARGRCTGRARCPRPAAR